MLQGIGRISECRKGEGGRVRRLPAVRCNLVVGGDGNKLAASKAHGHKGHIGTLLGGQRHSHAAKGVGGVEEGEGGGGRGGGPLGVRLPEELTVQ